MKGRWRTLPPSTIQSNDPQAGIALFWPAAQRPIARVRNRRWLQLAGVMIALDPQIRLRLVTGKSFQFAQSGADLPDLDT